MNYFRKLILSMKEVILIYILQYLIIIGFSFFYLIILNGKNINNFITSWGTIILLIFYILFIIITFNRNRCKYKKVNVSNYIGWISIGVSSAVFLNMIIFLFKINSITSDVNIYLLILSAGIIGPIFEEVLFRLIWLNRLRKFNSNLTSIIINSILFAVMHNSLINIIYAFILGFILNYVYIKYDDIRANIIVHISANLIVLLLYKFDIILLILSLILGFVNYKYMKKRGYLNEKRNFKR